MLLTASLACACLACPAPSPSSASTSGDTQPSRPAPTPEPPAPEQPTQPPKSEVPPVPAVKLPQPVGDCPSLAPLPDDASASVRALVPVVEAMRAVSCDPGVFGRSLDAARESLAIPSEVPFELGRRYARFDLGEKPVAVADLLAAMGVGDANMRFENGWRPEWVIELTPWGPGIVTFSIAADRHGSAQHGEVAELLPDATVHGSVRVVMPPDAIGFEDDPHAAGLLASTLGQLAKRPALLRAEPEQARVELDGLGERFDLYRYSEGSGDQQRVGFTIRARRTELVAADFAKALGLEQAAHQAIRITDTNPNRLTNEGQTPFVWETLELEVELDARDGGMLGLHRWTVSGIQILPKSTE